MASTLEVVTSRRVTPNCHQLFDCGGTPLRPPSLFVPVTAGFLPFFLLFATFQSSPFFPRPTTVSAKCRGGGGGDDGGGGTIDEGRGGGAASRDKMNWPLVSLASEGELGIGGGGGGGGGGGRGSDTC